MYYFKNIAKKFFFIPFVCAGLFLSCGSGIMKFSNIPDNSSFSNQSESINYNQVSTPLFNLPSGIYNSNIAIEIKAFPDDALIYYTSDGSSPTSNSTEYKKPIPLEGSGSSITIKAIAIKENYKSSAVAEGNFSIKLKLDKPELDVEAGVYAKAFTLNFSSAINGVSFKYTSDGSDPTTSGTAKTGSSVRINKTTTLKYIATHSDWDHSQTGEVLYRFPNKTLSTTIQAAINTASAGDIILIPAGSVYTENFTLDKQVILIGEGQGDDPIINTIIRKNTDDAIATITASGESELNPIMLNNLRIEYNRQGGSTESGAIAIPSAYNVSYLELNRISVIGTSDNSASNYNENGLYVAKDASLSNLIVKNSVFDELAYGFYFHKEIPDAGSNVSHVEISDTSFTNNDIKGIYAEKLSFAEFSNVFVYNNGKILTWMPQYIKDWNGGIDINLKAGNYEDISFTDLVFYRNGMDSEEGTGLAIKARGSGTDGGGGGLYTANPATLKDITILNCSVYGNERGVRLGEPDNILAEPRNVIISNSNIYSNNHTYVPGNGIGSDYGGLVNMTSASVLATDNWWGDTSGPTHSGNASGTGEIIFDTGFGSVDYSSWSALNY